MRSQNIKSCKILSKINGLSIYGVKSKGFHSHHFCNFRQDLIQEQSSYRIKSTFGNEAQSKATIWNWLKEFSHSRKNLGYDIREGQPRRAVTSERNDGVRKL